MKYFKFTKIDTKTGISINSGKSLNGQSFPDVKNLQIIAQDAIITEYWYGVAPNTTKENPDNHFFEITYEELVNSLKLSLQRIKSNLYERLFYNEKLTRDDVLGKYHYTALIAGLYKVDQARELFINPDADASDIRLEAEVRGITPLEMATKILERYEQYRQLEAIIAGIRGMLGDRISNFELDENDVVESWKEFESEEIVDSEIIVNYETEESEEVYVKVKKYGADIRGYLNPKLKSLGLV